MYLSLDIMMFLGQGYNHVCLSGMNLN